MSELTSSVLPRLRSYTLRIRTGFAVPGPGILALAVGRLPTEGSRGSGRLDLLAGPSGWRRRLPELVEQQIDA